MNSYELNRIALEQLHLDDENEPNSPTNSHSNSSSSSSSITVRLCHIKKRINDKDGGGGYGFNLMSKRDKLCQYVGKVDPDTPAYEAGLRTGDKIIEIDNQNVSRMSYRQIIDLLRKGRRIGNNAYRPDELLLLVVDQSTDDFFRIANIQVSSHNASIPIEFKSSQLKPIPMPPVPTRPAPLPSPPKPRPVSPPLPTQPPPSQQTSQPSLPSSHKRTDMGTNTSPDRHPSYPSSHASSSLPPRPPQQYRYGRIDVGGRNGGGGGGAGGDDSFDDDLVDEISININLNSSGSAASSSGYDANRMGSTTNKNNNYSNSSFNSSLSTNNTVDDVELITFV